MTTRRKQNKQSKRKRSSLRKRGGTDSPTFSYGDVFSNNTEARIDKVNPMHATTYVIKYTKLSNGKITNKEVFIQGEGSYKHYMIDKDEDDEEFEETTHKCYQSIAFDQIGNYLNSPFDQSKCGIELQQLAK